MQNCPQKLRSWFKNGAYLGLAVIFIFMCVGCTSTRKTTKTTTVVTSSDQQKVPDTQKSDSSTNTATETTTSTTETKPTGHPGIISSTVHAIGWVIALPFRLVGGLIGWIF